MRMGLEIAEVGHLQRQMVGGFEDDGWREAGLAGFLPAAGAKAPAVPGLQPWEAIFRARGGQIIA